MRQAPISVLSSTPGDASFPLAKQITALGLDALGSLWNLIS
jgi:hypothetical protein